MFLEYWAEGLPSLMANPGLSSKNPSIFFFPGVQYFHGLHWRLAALQSGILSVVFPPFTFLYFRFRNIFSLFTSFSFDFSSFDTSLFDSQTFNTELPAWEPHSCMQSDPAWAYLFVREEKQAMVSWVHPPRFAGYVPRSSSVLAVHVRYNGCFGCWILFLIRSENGSLLNNNKYHQTAIKYKGKGFPRTFSGRWGIRC